MTGGWLVPVRGGRTNENIAAFGDLEPPFTPLLDSLESLQECDEARLVEPQNLSDIMRLVRIRNENFKDVESLELDVCGRRPEDEHDGLQVLLIRNIAHHDFEVISVEEKFGEQLEGLPLQHVIIRCEDR